MKFFIDTANLEEIAEMSAYGIVDGVTTNPSIIAREGKDLKETLIRICNMVDGPISGEVLAPDAETMIKEGLEIAGWHRNMVVKIPMTPEGIKAVRADVYKRQHQALDLGIRLFDHADVYGFGKSEEIFGEILDLKTPSVRERIQIQSKRCV